MGMKYLKELLSLSLVSFCILFLMSWTWYLTIVIRVGLVSPLNVMEIMSNDLIYLGKWAFILDILFLLLVYVFYKKVKSKQLDKDTYNV
jgi:hypothetical protein